jgi:hydroxyethylthiazole kinase-like uncharacterized protein yjeF
MRDWRLGVTPAEMRAVDELAEREYGLAPPILMEVAGLATARVARMIIDRPLEGTSILVLAGPGNNGADGMVAARRLAGWGARASVLTSFDPAEGRGLAADQLASAAAAGISCRSWSAGEDLSADLVVDALLGFGAAGAPRGRVAQMIDAVGAAASPVLALDIPSGLNAETGEAAPTCTMATATVTLALPKTGLVAERGRARVGALYLADIGIPRGLLRQLGIETAGLFEDGDIVRMS